MYLPKRVMTEADIREFLRAKCAGRTKAEVAREIGISNQRLVDFLKDPHANPSGELLKALGLVKRVVYRRASDDEA